MLGMSRRTFIALLVLGVAVRLAMHSLVAYDFDLGDAAGYRLVAYNLVKHHVYSAYTSGELQPSAYRPPLYSAFLAGLRIVTCGEEHIWLVQLVQLLLSLGAGLSLTAVAARYEPQAAKWVLLLIMVSPFEAVFAGTLLSENLATALLAASAASLWLLRGWRSWVVGGALAGLLVLCRDIYLPLLVLTAGLWLFFGTGGRAMRVKQAALLLAATGLVVAPWTVRNAVQFDRIIPVSAGRLGFSLWLGTWATDAEFTKSDATGRRIYPPEATRTPEERAMLDEAVAPGVDPQHADALFRSLAGARLRSEPVRVVGRCLLRWPRLWLGTRFDIFTLNRTALPYGSRPWTVVKAALWGLNAVFLVLGLVGAVVVIRRKTALRWALVPLAFTGAVYFPLNSFENRYSQPVLQFALLLGGCAVTPAFEWWRNRSVAPRAPAT
jgi:hypothetical protein